MTVAIRLLISCSLATGAGLAFGQPSNPYFLGASVGFLHDDNIFRVPPESGAVVSDTTRLYGVQGGFDQVLGRQRIFARADLRRNSHSRSSQLDFTGYQLETGVDWSTVERISGQLKANVRRGQTAVEPALTAVSSSNRAIETSRQFVSSAEIGTVTPLTMAFNSDYEQREVRGTVERAADYRRASARVGAVYRPSSAIALGTGLRVGRTSYPASMLGYDYAKRSEVDAQVQWQATGASTLDTRLAWTRTRHTVDQVRDYDGLTGSIAWTWNYSERTGLRIGIGRDAGEPALSFTDSAALVGYPATTTDRVSLLIRYSLTPGITLTLAGSRSARSSAVPAAGGAGIVESTLTSARAGLRWLPAPSVEANCEFIQNESRSAGAGTVARGFSASVFGCNVAGRTL